MEKVSMMILAGAGTIGIVLILLVYRATASIEIDLVDHHQAGIPGDLISVTRIGKYPAWVMRLIVGSAGIEGNIEIAHGFTSYRLKYLTTQFDGSIVEATGLVAVPNKKDQLSVVVYLHGTNAQRNSAPSSAGSQEGLLVSALAAGSAHILVAPDLIGLGESYDVHPYLYSETTVSTSLDFLSASKSWMQSSISGFVWPNSLFLIGFSQGGHATFALHRELERQLNPPFTVAASAPVAGPFQLREISLSQAMTGLTDSHEYYLGYLASAYAQIYNQPIHTLLREPYAGSIPSAFDGSRTVDEITKVLPELPVDMFTEEFLQAYRANQPHWFLDALEENSVLNWIPKAPVRIYYGENDIDVLPQEALEAEEWMRVQGADVTAISVGPRDHNESVLYAIPAAISWFNELASTKAP
jgi:pimeloyl-ACP methyl ester carboxylesterase